MRFVKGYIHALVLFTVLFYTVQDSSPCDGTLNPPCARAIYLAKFAPTTVVLPASGPINVPIGLLPFVSWDNVNTNTCGQPTGATLSLTLSCTPIGGGSPVTVGPLNITVPTPTVPGAQMNISSPVTVTIPAGAVTSPSVCLVQGTYTVTFGGGSTGSGTLSGSGDVEICIVEPSPLDDTLPRLSMERLSLDPEDPGFSTCRRGDQNINYFLIANNDPDNAVTFTFDSRTRQAAGLPDGISAADAPGMAVRAISSPVPGTDAFPQDFGFAPCALIDLPDPGEVSDRLITRDFTLPPNGATIVPVAIRSYGRCADGSCNEQTVKITGTFADQSPAVACVGTLLLVEDVPAKTPLCEMQDIVQVGGNTDGIWGPAWFLDEFGADGLVGTHTVGNVEDFFDRPGRSTWTRGESFNDPLHPPTSASHVRSTPDSFFDVSYEVEFFAGDINFVPTINQVTITGLETLPSPGSVAVPLIALNDGNFDPLEIILDIPMDNVVINRGTAQVFSGNFAEFTSGPPTPFFVELPTERQFFKSRDGIAIRSEPNLIVLLTPNIVDPDGNTPALQSVFEAGSDTLMITDQNGTPVDWTAEVRGAGITLQSATGNGQLVFDFNTDGLGPVPATPVAFIDIISPLAINLPLTVPVAFRVDTSNTTGVNSHDPVIPETTQLAQNYPNPFNPTTSIAYRLESATRVELRIYNQLGQEIRTLVDDNQPAGTYQVNWDGRNNHGEKVSSGIYLYRLKTSSDVQSRKMLLLK